MIVKSLLWDKESGKWADERPLTPVQRIDFPNGEYSVFYRARGGEQVVVIFNPDRGVKHIEHTGLKYI